MIFALSKLLWIIALRAVLSNADSSRAGIESKALTEPEYIGGAWLLQSLEQDEIARRRIKALLDAGIRYSRATFWPDIDRTCFSSSS